MALTQRDLEGAVCEKPDCTTRHESTTPLHLTSRCHEGAPVEAIYRGDGLLVIQCSVCHRLIANIAVAP